MSIIEHQPGERQSADSPGCEECFVVQCDECGECWVVEPKSEELEFNVHLDDCDIVRYALQLSTYEYLVLKGGYVPRNTSVKRAIVHLGEDGYKIIPTASYPIEVRDMIIAANLDNVPF